MKLRNKNESPWAPLSATAYKRDSVQAGKKILIVDDDAVILKTLSMILKSAGYEVVTATDGSEAIGVMRDDAPDLMLVDVCLPPGLPISWDGFQVAQWLRAVNGAIPTIVISGADKPEYAQQAAATGAHAFIAKPINNQLLLDTIASVLARNHESKTAAKN